MQVKVSENMFRRKILVPINERDILLFKHVIGNNHIIDTKAHRAYLKQLLYYHGSVLFIKEDK